VANVYPFEIENRLEGTRSLEAAVFGVDDAT
jgi:hypothetical protein